MQKRSTFYSLWLVPTGEAFRGLQKTIRALSHKYNTPGFSPHVTLASGIGGSPAEVVSRGKELTQHVKSLQVAFPGVEGRDEYYRCLFLRAKESRCLLEAHRRAVQVFGLPAHAGFMPHLSLVYGNLSRAQKAGIIAEAVSQAPRLVKMHQLWLVHIRGGPPGWRVIWKRNLAA